MEELLVLELVIKQLFFSGLLDRKWLQPTLGLNEQAQKLGLGFLPPDENKWQSG